MAADSTAVSEHTAHSPLDAAWANGHYLGQVRSQAITTEIETSYIDYAMSVIVARALPDARDGLKPVQRRILYAMYADLTLRPNAAYKKSARIVGEVLGKYHPHGDEAVYAAMARMVQDFSLRYPLVDGQGNFGSIDGDNPAAMRYTEARLAPLTLSMLEDIDKDTVDWGPNFDESLEEPLVLPTLLPNLLINGTSGIAVGMATNIPPHNVGEIMEALKFLLDNWERRDTVSLDELMQFVPGPDFPMGGQILGAKGIREAFASGHGKIRLRADAEIEELPRGNRHQLVFSSIPYQINKATLIARVAAVVRRGEHLQDIVDLHDESDRHGIRIVFVLKTGAVPTRVLNQLYRYSDLETSYSVNLRALVNLRPERLNLQAALLCHLEHRIEVVIRRTRFLLRRVQDRAHVLEGLLTAIKDIDRVIQIVRSSVSAAAASALLRDEFALTPVQAQAILDLQLRRLSSLERQRLEEEYRDVQDQIATYRALLDDPVQLRSLIKEELTGLQERYQDGRRTKILYGVDPELSDEDLVTIQDDLISYWANGNLRRTLASDFSVQGRGGIGVISRSDREEAAVSRMLFANSLDTLLFISNRGRAYSNRVYNLPSGARTSKGSTVRGAISMELADEVPDAWVCVPTDAEPKSLILITRKGRVKRLQFSRFAKLMSRGKRAITLLPEDSVVQALVTNGHSDLLLVSRMGKALRVSETEFRYQGEQGTGVRGMKLASPDEVMGTVCVTDDASVLVIYAYGKGKRVSMHNWRTLGRNTQGRWIAPRQKRSELGVIAGIDIVGDDDDVALVSAKGMLVRIRSASVSCISPGAVGVKIMGLGDDDRIAAVSVLPPAPDVIDDVQAEEVHAEAQTPVVVEEIAAAV